MLDRGGMHELMQLHYHGVFLRREALAFGYDDRALSLAIRDKLIVRLRHGAYVAREPWEVADACERHRLLCHAVLLAHGDGVVLTHTSAAVMHGLDVWNCDLSVVHLTRTDEQTTRQRPDIAYHHGKIPDDHLVELGEGRLMSAAVRAAVEHATISSIESGLCTVNSFLHLANQTDLAAVRGVHESMAQWPGTQALNITLRLARPGVESVGESRVVYLCWEFHLPSPEHQFEVRDPSGHLIGLSDFAWRKHRMLGEFDGKTKFEKFLRDGESPADALFREKHREDLMREYSGFGMIRFIWSDFRTRRRTADRLRRQLGLD